MSYEKCLIGKLNDRAEALKEAQEAIDLHKDLVDGFIKDGHSPRAADDMARKQATKTIAEKKKAGLVAKVVQVEKQAQHIKAIRKAKTNVRGKRDPRAHLADVVDEFDARNDMNRSIFHQIFSELLEQHGYKYTGAVRDKKNLVDILREAYGEDTGNAQAKKFAKSLEEASLTTHRLFKKEGVIIPADKDYRMAQNHDAVRMATLGKSIEESRDIWVNDHIDNGLLDWAKMSEFRAGRPIKPDDVKLQREILNDVFDEIVNDGHTGKRAYGARGDGASLQTKLAHRRFLRYKDADSWLHANERYMTGDVFDAITSNIDTVANDLTLAQIFGPNPSATKRVIDDAVVDMSRQISPKLRQKASAIVGGNSSQWNQAWEIMTRANSVGSDQPLATLAGGIRSGLISALLGSTSIIATASDKVTSHIAGSFVGFSKSRQMQMAAEFVSLINPASSASRRSAARAGVMLDNFVSQQTQQMRFFGESGGPEWMGKVTDMSLRAGGLPQVTQARQQAASLEFMGLMADNRKTPFTKLDKNTRNWLRDSGVTEKDWDLYRQTEVHDPDGRHIIRPKDMRMRKDVDETTALDVAEKFHLAQMKFQRIAVPTSSTRAQAFLGGGASAGSPYGELVRSIKMLKNFPVTIMLEHMSTYLGHAIQRKGWGSKGYFAAMVIGLTGAGVASMQIKSVLSGATPYQWDDERLYAAAALKGGGLGILGDFLFSDLNRYGGGLADTLAGPMWQGLTDVKNLTIGNTVETIQGEDTNFAKEGIRFLTKYMPLSNHPFVAPFKQQMLESVSDNPWRDRMNYIRRLEESGREPLLLY